MVTRRRLLLEAVLVLLVDNDQAEVPRRREHRAARPDDDLNLAPRNPPPMIASLGVMQVAVQHRDVAAAPLERANRLRRQADLRH